MTRYSHGFIQKPSVGAFLPTDLANLEFWFDAAVGVTTGAGTDVASWADQSGNSRTASQASVPNRPAESSDSGFTSLEYDGADGLSSGDISPDISYTEGLLFAVARITGGVYLYSSKELPSGNDAVWLRNDSQTNLNCRIRVNAGSDAVVDLAQTNTTLFWVTFDFDNDDTGNAESSQAGPTSDTLGTARVTNRFNLGSFTSTGSTGFVGHLFEIGFYSQRHTGSSLTDLQNYLASKYSI